MTSSPTSLRPRPTRPITRGAGARDRVLRAALDLLADEGYTRFTMEAVAARARASKATVYRRWSTSAELLVEAMALVSQPAPFSPTGALRDDLVELLTRFHRLMNDQAFARLLAALVDAAERDPAVAALHAELAERRREPVRRVLRRACESGDLPRGCDIELAVDLLTGPAVLRRLIGHRPTPTDYPLAIVDHVLAALRHTSIE